MNWDAYYLKICDAVASNSKCLSRKIGAILVKDKSIISTGYNGPPRGVPPCSEREMIDTAFEDALHKRIDKLNRTHVIPSPGQEREIAESDLIIAQQRADDVALCPRQRLGFKSGQGLEFCVATHSEVNALVQAARHGISTKGATMYMNCSQCCKNCLGVIINAGIEELVITDWKPYDDISAYIIKESQIRIRKFDL